MARPVVLASYDNPLPYYNHLEENDKRKWEDDTEAASNIAKAQHTQAYEDSLSNHSQDEDSLDDDDDRGNGPRKPGRKPMENGSHLLEPDIKQKRKAQNRAAQRAFRERKERYVKELEAKIKSIEHAHLINTAQLMKENQQLKTVIQRLQCQNLGGSGGLPGIGFEFTLPQSPISNGQNFQTPTQPNSKLPSSTKPGQKKKGLRKLVPIAPHPGNRNIAIGRPQPKLMPKPAAVQGIQLQSGASATISLPKSSDKLPAVPDQTASMTIAANSSPEWGASPTSSVASGSPTVTNVNNPGSPETGPQSPLSCAGSDNSQSDHGSASALGYLFAPGEDDEYYNLEDEQSFFNLLKDQSANEAVNRLFEEPLFDLSGALNDTTLNKAMSMTTEALTEKNLKAQNESQRKQNVSELLASLQSNGSDHGSSDEDNVNNLAENKTANANEIWQRRI
ncbi:DNA-binding transcription factor yap1 [Umbelopsis sp. WA50703]